MADIRRRTAAQNIAEQLYLPGYVDTIYANLRYASAGEIRWATTADATALRAAAREAPDRYTPDNIPVNPFWYHVTIE